MERSADTDHDLADLQIAYEAHVAHAAKGAARLVAQLEEEHELRAGYLEAVAQAQHQAASAEAVAEDLRHSVRNREDQIAALQAHVVHLDAELAAREAHLADIEANRDAVQASLDAVQNSKTMRALRPFRGVYRRVRERARP
jgi:chromosome segregation ATPase